MNEPRLEFSTARPLDRVERDFSGADITLVYDRVADPTGARRLVFGVVELLHDAFEFAPERPVRHGDACKRLENGQHELNLRRVRLGARQAVEWYRRCSRGIGVVPPVTHERKDHPNGHPMLLPAYGEEPPWPGVSLEANEEYWERAPFWGTRPGGTRRHQLIALDPSFSLSNWNEGTRAKARAWLAKQLPIDLFERPRLFGSLHLILTNPVFGQVHLRLNRDNRSQVFLAFQRWSRRPFPPLSVRLLENRATGPAIDETVIIKAAQATLQLPHEPHVLSVTISSEEQGLLYSSPPAVFIRQITTDVQLVGVRRHVSVPKRSRARVSEEYPVDVATSVETVKVGEPTLPNALASLIREEAELQERREAQRLGQRWFNQQRDEATLFIRKLIGDVQSDALIVDPYFGHVEFLRFACAPSNATAIVRILTSEEHLKSSSVAEMSAGDALQRALSEVSAKDRTLTVQVRVAEGGRAPIHDRFIVLDERNVWLLGSSLNEFGSRGSIAVRLPYGTAIYEKLQECWARSPNLNDWLAEQTRPKE